MIFFKKQQKEPENIAQVLAKFKDLEEKFKEALKELKDLKEKNKFCIQKIGMIRFNPFKEVGGDQSFSLALLDENDSGAVITSYYSRKENKIYGKPLKNGKSDYPLSDEEILAIDKARNFGQPALIKEEEKNSGKNKKKKNGK
jgi:hypothetical protein